MFDRYSEKARRTIFFARYEASVLGCDRIELSHLVLGLLRENYDLKVVIGGAEGLKSFRDELQVLDPPRPSIPTSVDLPLAPETKTALHAAAEEAGAAGQEAIDGVHLMAGVLRQDQSPVAGMLQRRGLTLDLVRERIAQIEPQRRSSGSSPASQLLPRPELFGRILITILEHGDSDAAKFLNEHGITLDLAKQRFHGA